MASGSGAKGSDPAGNGKGITDPPAVGIALVKPTFQIEVPDLRNGALVSIQQAAPKAAMSGIYHWPIINDLTHDKYMDAIDHVVRSVFAHGLHMLGAASTDTTAAAFRRKAIVLAGIRVGAISAYKLSRIDLVQAELTSSGMQYNPAADSISQQATGSTSSTRWTAARSMAGITAEEMEVIGACVYMGMAVPVMQGVSLVMTGHHYIPSTYNMFKGLKRQALGAASTATRAWVDSMGEEFDDMAFHKATHSISFVLKRSLAKNLDTKARLSASGHGSAAIRLPAVPSEASGGKASVALCLAAAPTIEQMGQSVSVETGLKLLQDLDHAAEGQEEADACDKVVSWVAHNSKTLAFFAGIVQQVHEVSGTGKNTVLAAYSVKRIMAENPSQVNKGVMYARAANLRMKEEMESGTFRLTNLTL